LKVLPKGAPQLKKDVFEPGLCTACGGCVGYCPYIKAVADRVAMIYPCNCEEGQCYQVCPRTLTDLPFFRAQVFGERALEFNKLNQDNLEAVLGVCRALYFARAGAAAGSFKGQYGGVTTSLMRYALATGKIDGTLLVGGKPSQPRPVLATSLQQVEACAGSKYAAFPTLSMLYQPTQNISFLGLVGRPCQVTALRKMQQVEAGAAGQVKLAIGLFCFWSLGPEFIPWLIETGLGLIDKMDVTVNEVLFQKGEEVIRQNPAEIQSFIKPSCQLCYDPVAELADLAVGSTEYEADWNTLIVRSQAGEDLVKEALQQGILEVKPYPKERLPLLKQAVFAKKQRVLQALKVEKGNSRVGYLNLSPAEINFYLKLFR
jgi:coenzyme F420-reducing hydrogenase beta subunit